MKKYKKPLSETKHVDKWRCPYCRKIIKLIPRRLQYSGYSFDDGEFEEKCPECGEISTLFISPTFYARPYKEE